MDPFEKTKTDEVHLTLISDAGTVDSKNTAYKIKNKLAIPLQTSGDQKWELSLQFISMSKKINNQAPVDTFSERESEIKEKYEELGIPGDFSVNNITAFITKLERHLRITRTRILNLKKKYYRDYKDGNFNYETTATAAKELNEHLKMLRGLKLVLYAINDLYVEMTFCKFKDSYSPIFVEVEEVESVFSSHDKIIA